MALPYRTRKALRGLGIGALIFLLIAAIALLCWLLWLDRFIIYSRDGAQLNFNLSPEFSPGILAEPPTAGETVSIYYNEGDAVIDTSTELTQLSGYYVDAAALIAGVADVRAQLEQLPAGTPVMIDLKNPYGSFYYSSSVGSTSSEVDIGAVDDLISYLRSSTLYTIARVPALRDRQFGLDNVPAGLFLPSGIGLWPDDQGCYWLNPTHDATQTYLIQIATELRGLGFDEVVFTEFRFPDSANAVFDGDKAEALASTAETLVESCTTDTFAVSFAVQDAGLTLPDGRCRMYLENAAAADVKNLAEQTGLADPEIRLVFLTEANDTRYDDYGALRPLSTFYAGEE